MESAEGLGKCTFHGLQKWYCRVFSTLGWKILAHHYNKSEKTDEYIKNVQDLLDHIKSNISDFSADKQRDLKIMQKHVEILLEHAKKDFQKGTPVTQNHSGGKRGSRKRSSRKRSTRKRSTRKGSTETKW